MREPQQESICVRIQGGWFGTRPYRNRIHKRERDNVGANLCVRPGNELNRYQLNQERRYDGKL
jgi:hypothetical protein